MLAAESPAGPPLVRLRRLAGSALGSPVAIYVRTMGIFVVAWELIATQVGNSLILPPPHEVAASWSSLLLDGSMVNQTLTSLSRLVVAYAIAASLGYSLGLSMGLSRTAFDLFDPLVETLRPISAIAWIPLALVFFGVGYALPIFILVYVSIFPLILNTVAGVRSTDPRLIRAAVTMGASRGTVIRQVIVPGSLAAVLTGVRLSAALGWMALIAAELVGAPSGLGFSIQFYAGLFRSAEMIAMIATVAMLGFLTDAFLRWLQRRVSPWAFT